MVQSDQQCHVRVLAAAELAPGDCWPVASEKRVGGGIGGSLAGLWHTCFVVLLEDVRVVQRGVGAG